jgi:hypothetical protein
VGGYEAPTTAFALRFEDHPGLEVKATSVPLGVFSKLSRLADLAGGATDATLAKAAEGLGELDDLLVTFGEALVDWNVTIKGEPVPPTYEGVCRLDFPFALELIFGWMDAIGGVEAPLAKRSPSGGPALAASLQMEPLSDSQAS